MVQKRKFLENLFLIVLATVFFSACSNGTENNTAENGSYETKSAEIGHNAAQSIQAPMDRAESAVDLENERLNEYDKSIREQ